MSMSPATSVRKRYNPQTLDIHYKGKTIADVLRSPVMRLYLSLKIFQVSIQIKTLVDVGLGYIQLGQSATTLSG